MVATIDFISESQANKATTANNMFEALRPFFLYGIKHTGTTGLSFSYYGGLFQNGTGTLIDISDGSVSITASATNYVEANASTGAVTVNQSAFTVGAVPLYEVVADAVGMTAINDKRSVSLGVQV